MTDRDTNDDVTIAQIETLRCVSELEATYPTIADLEANTSARWAGTLGTWAEANVTWDSRSDQEGC